MDSLLRDINREKSKMEDDVANLYRHFEKLRGYVRQHLEQATVEWAKLLIDHPKALVLIIETTRIVDEHGSNYEGSSEPIRFTALPLAGGEIWDQLLHPSYSLEIRGTEYHGLAMADLDGKPRLAEAWSEIAENLEGQHLIIFGADWARGALQSVYQTNVLNGAYCLHNKVKEYYDEFYDLSLVKVLSYQRIEKMREELIDSRERVLMLATVMRNLAGGMKKYVPKSETSDPFADLDGHPF